MSKKFIVGRFSTLNYNRKPQVPYFHDTEYMEQVGIKNKGHVALQDSFMESFYSTS